MENDTFDIPSHLYASNTKDMTHTEEGKKILDLCIFEISKKRFPCHVFVNEAPLHNQRLEEYIPSNHHAIKLVINSLKRAGYDITIKNVLDGKYLPYVPPPMPPNNIPVIRTYLRIDNPY